MLCTIITIAAAAGGLAKATPHWLAAADYLPGKLAAPAARLANCF